MHHILERQIKKIFKGELPSFPEREAFLEAVSSTYDSYDQDHTFLEHSFDLSSKEFIELNSRVLKLLEDLKIEKESVEQKVVERTQELKQKVGELKVSNQLLIKRGDELALANKRLSELDKAKTEFIRTAAHQLRTPLTPILWVLKELEDTVKKKEVKKQIENALTRTKDVIRLVDSMLDVSRIETGKFLSEKQPMDIKKAVNDAFKNLEPMAHKKNLIYIMRLPEEKILPMQLAQEFVQGAVGNLIQNAIDYTPEGGSVTVSVEQKDNTVLIRVRDTGIGITSEERDKIFTKLYRSRRSIRLQPNGMGIGLYIARQIVAAHNGELILEESEEGKGSTFRITLSQERRE